MCAVAPPEPDPETGVFGADNALAIGAGGGPAFGGDNGLPVNVEARLNTDVRGLSRLEYDVLGKPLIPLLMLILFLFAEFSEAAGECVGEKVSGGEL